MYRLTIFLLFVIIFNINNSYAELNFPNIDPVAFKIGSFGIHWYGLSYLLSLIIIVFLSLYFVKRNVSSNITIKDVENLILNSFIAALIGGRLGYVFLYDTHNFLDNPFTLFQVWKGGMSFHGGLVGAVIGTIYTAKITKKDLIELSETTIPFIPIGLGLGRVANFINDELWGRLTNVPWGVKFPNGGFLPRHPSQIYEAILEGVILFIILVIMKFNNVRRGIILGTFFIGYGLSRIIIEFFREPDIQLGFFLQYITMGQILSIPMVVFGVILLVKFGIFNSKLK